MSDMSVIDIPMHLSRIINLINNQLTAKSDIVILIFGIELFYFLVHETDTAHNKLIIAKYIVLITTFCNFGQYLNSLNC